MLRWLWFTFFLYMFLANQRAVHFSLFSPLSPFTEVSPQLSAIPGGNSPEDWQSAVGWGDTRFEPGTAGQQSGALPLSHRASLCFTSRGSLYMLRWLSSLFSTRRGPLFMLRWLSSPLHWYRSVVTTRQNKLAVLVWLVDVSCCLLGESTFYLHLVESVAGNNSISLLSLIEVSN
jgi:hypothetical protein